MSDNEETNVKGNAAKNEHSMAMVNKASRIDLHDTKNEGINE
jgi:hypothetical protein